MFTFWKKNMEYDQNKLYAFVDGKTLPLEEVKDEVFSQKMMGDGIAIIPTSNRILAPCNGVVTMIFPTLHAFGITMDNGVEILIHIGLNTVELKSIGFKSLVKVGDRVKIGTPIMKVDFSLIKQKGYDVSTILIVVKPNGYCFTFNKEEDVVGGTDIIGAISIGEEQ